LLRERWQGVYITNGGYDLDKANAAITSGAADNETNWVYGVADAIVFLSASEVGKSRVLWFTGQEWGV